MSALTLIAAACGLCPAFAPEQMPPTRPLLWETPVSWNAPAPAVKPGLDFYPPITEKITAARKINDESGPDKAAASLAKNNEPELVLMRAAFKKKAGDLAGAMRDYEIVLDSKNRTIPRALAVQGFKNILRQRIEAGEKNLYSRLIQTLKHEWRNEEALAILPSIMAEPSLPAAARTYISQQEPIMALRLGEYDRAARLWAAPSGPQETQWLAQTEARRGNFIRASEIRLDLASRMKGKARNQEITTAWEVLAKGGLYTEADSLAQKYQELQKAPDYKWRMGLAALYAGKYDEAKASFAAITQGKPGPRTQGASYFLARTLETAGQHDAARELYSLVAEGPFGYYRILAEGRLAADPKEYLAWEMDALLNSGPAGQDRDSLGFYLWISEKGFTETEMTIAADKLAAAATILAGGKNAAALNVQLKELLHKKDWRNLNRLIKHNEQATGKSSPEAAELWPRLAASIAASEGNYRKAVSLFSRIPNADPKGLKRWSHPIIYSQQIKAALREHNLPPSLVLALIRTESAYQADIMSASNARGLMQLLPATANKVAASLGEEEPDDIDLFDPSLNIRYGTWYLAALIKGFCHEALALAGYNGGPYNIRSLILAKPDMPIDIFVESLPFEETANYVKRITESRYIYETTYLGRANLPDLSGPVTVPASTLPTF